jgi:hypothetical protein
MCGENLYKQWLGVLRRWKGSHTVRDRGSQYCRSIHRDFEVNRLSSDMVHGRAYSRSHLMEKGFG